MAKYRLVRTEFWTNPIVSEEMTPEDRYFYLYLLTNPHTTQIGIYKITKKQIAFDMGYSIESVQSLIERFVSHHKLIRYNPETRELAIKNWGKENLHKGGKPVIDCISSELKEVQDHSLILYVAEDIHKQEIKDLYESFCKKEQKMIPLNSNQQEENQSYITEENEMDDPFPCRFTIRGQKEKEKENKKEKQQQKSFDPSIARNLSMDPYLQNVPDAKEIIEFWDSNGFGFSNIHAKQQLLSWLEDSRFLQPKAVILKAMQIACINNKRRLNYIVGILKNWQDESLLTVEEIDSYQKNEKPENQFRSATQPTFPTGRAIPGLFTLDLTAGEES